MLTFRSRSLWVLIASLLVVIVIAIQGAMLAKQNSRLNAIEADLDEVEANLQRVCESTGQDIGCYAARGRGRVPDLIRGRR